MSRVQSRKRKLKVDETEKKLRRTEENIAEDEHLTNILFGESKSFLKSLEEAELEEKVVRADVDSGVGESDESDGSERRPAWTDEDDGIDVGDALDAQGRRLPDGGVNSRGNQYGELLRTKFTSSIGAPSWAELKVIEDEDEELLQSCGFIKGGKTDILSGGSLEFKKVKDLNAEMQNEGYINVVEFHPSASVALVAGNSGVATLYAVDGKRNNKLHSIQFEKFPILSGKFLGADEALLGSRYPYIYSYDLTTAKHNRIPLRNLTQCKIFAVADNFLAIAGRFGEIHILSTRSKERLFILKQDAEVTALSFNSDATLLYSHSSTGEISLFDLSTRRLKHKFQDEGALNGTTISISPSDQFLAAASGQGVVNVYRTDSLETGNPRPFKSLLNLTTSIVDLRFNPTSEMLAFASSDIENSVRLMHLSSTSVYSNFPTFGTRLGRINRIAFSPNGGYLALGNAKSTVPLFRLKHYKNY